MRKRTKAIIFINIYCIFDTLDNIFAKVCSEKGVSPQDLAYSRIFFNFLSATSFLIYNRQRILSPILAEHKCAITYRSIMQGISQYLNLLSLSLLPISMFSIIQNTSAFWVCILGYLVNGEVIYCVEFVGIIACFFGVCLIAGSVS